MRRQRAPTGLRLAVFLLFAANVKTSSSQYLQIDHTATKEHLVCKKPDSHLCVTWHLGPVDPDTIIEESPSNATQFCGLSDLKRILPHRKFITVKSLASGGLSRVVFCKGFTELKGDILNWKQVEKTLNALSRTRRQTAPLPRGRYRGQTQSQYLAIDRGNGKDEGKAEAHSAADSSRASVSGNSGMGQAQSQSIYDPSCDDCYGKSNQEVESLKRGPYNPGGEGNMYAPGEGYGSSGSYRPGQGSGTGSHQPGAPIDVTRPGVGYGPGVGNGGNGLNGLISGNGSYRPGQGSGPATSVHGGNTVVTPGDIQRGNGIYRPGALQGGSYGPGQGGQGSVYPSSSGVTPGVGGQGGNGRYGPGYGNGLGSSYTPPSGMMPGIGLGTNGGNGGYGPGQGPGSDSSYVPSSGLPGDRQGGSGSYRPGQGNRPSSNYGPSSGTAPSGSQGGSGGYGPSQRGTGGYGPTQGGSEGYGPSQGTNGGYGPSQGSSPGSAYGPNSGTIPGGVQAVNRDYGSGPDYGTPSGPTGGTQGGSGNYGPNSGRGLGTAGFEPSAGTPPSGGQGGNGGYGPQQGQQGGTGSYGPGQGMAPGPSGYTSTSGMIPSGRPGATGGYEPSQGSGQNTGYLPGKNGGNGMVNIGSSPNLNGVTPGSGQNRIPSGNTFNPGQGQGQSGLPIGSSFTPGQTNLPVGNYGSIQNGNTGNGGYSTPQGPLTNSGHNPIQTVVPGTTIPATPGGNVGYGQTNSVGPGRSGTMWPSAMGPYPGPPGSSIYCCVVPNSYGQNVGSSGNISPSTGTGYPSFGTGQAGPNVAGYESKPSGVPSNILGSAYVPGNTGSTNLQGTQEPHNLQSLGTHDNGLIGRPVTQDPYGKNLVGGPGNYGNYGGIGSPEGPGGQSTISAPGNYIPVTSGGPQGQNGIQGPGPYTTGGTSGSRPETYGTGIYGDPRLQGGFQQPGISGGLANQNGIQVPGGNMVHPGVLSGNQGPGNFGTTPIGGSGGPNGMQGPGNLGLSPAGGSGQNGMQGTGNFGTSAPGGTMGHNGIRGPGNFGTGPAGGSNQNGMQGTGNFGTNAPGVTVGQNGMQGPGNFGTGPTGGSGQNGIQGPGNFVSDPTGGPNQNGMQGIGIISTGPNSQNGLPGNYGAGTFREPQNGNQGTGTYVPGINGGVGLNGNQGQGVYDAGTPGGPGGQNGVQGIGTYGKPGGPGDQNGMQRPGVYDTGTSGGPNNQNGMQGPMTNNQGGNNGNIISGSGTSAYPGGTQFPLGSQGPGTGYPGYYGQEHQGAPTSIPSGNQQGLDSQGNPLQGNENIGIPQNYLDPNSIAIDGDDSEAEAIVNQAANGTTASASSKGGNDKGRAQTHVHGTYTGGGSFQAQAQITGENKEAESEVSGGKKGASSSATGSGRNNKSQASVQLGSETGSIQTQSQSNGGMHSSNSQVQGSVKGGMADAQAKGPGSTSSQAQIGFTPYKDGDKVHKELQTPFVGGGIASAQSSGRTGQSQSQLHGTFKYGITYNGAAQAGASVDKDAVFPNRLNFEKINVFDESQKNINVNPENPQNETPSTESIPLSEVPIETKINASKEEEITTEKATDETMKNSESRYLSHTHLDHHKIDTTEAPMPTAPGSRRSYQSGYENGGADYEYTTDKDEIQTEEDYPYGGEGNDASDVEQTVGEEFPNYDEYSRDYQTHQSLQSPHRSKGIEVQQSTGGNTQHIVLGSLNNHDAEITQKNSEKPDESKVYQPGERVPGTGGYRIPIGFTGSIKSVASKENTYVIGSKHSPSQAQTVTLTPGTGKVNYVYRPTYGKYVSPKDLRSLNSQNPKDDRYVSVSKSVTRALDGENNIRKQYSHTYYTKSSSCGYFTFTCTMVSGVDGRKKVCKPKMPTNPDGTPIRC